jgi:DNA-binding HxlR family transcriptional regulator
MCADKDHVYLCATGGILSIISKKWALLIIYKLGTRGRLRFSEFSTELDSINPQALSETLKDLVHEGFVERKSFSEIPPRVEYFLTTEGLTLWESIKPLIEWAAERDYRDKPTFARSFFNCRIFRTPAQAIAISSIVLDPNSG